MTIRWLSQLGAGALDVLRLPVPDLSLPEDGLDIEADQDVPVDRNATGPSECAAVGLAGRPVRRVARDLIGGGSASARGLRGRPARSPRSAGREVPGGQTFPDTGECRCSASGRLDPGQVPRGWNDPWLGALAGVGYRQVQSQMPAPRVPGHDGAIHIAGIQHGADSAATRG